jgi:hypothetical protein
MVEDPLEQTVPSLPIMIFFAEKFVVVVYTGHFFAHNLRSLLGGDWHNLLQLATFIIFILSPPLSFSPTKLEHTFFIIL